MPHARPEGPISPGTPEEPTAREDPLPTLVAPAMPNGDKGSGHARGTQGAWGARPPAMLPKGAKGSWYAKGPQGSHSVVPHHLEEPLGESQRMSPTRLRTSHGLPTCDRLMKI